MTDIVKPTPETIELFKHNQMLVWCDCSAAFPCPQGKLGTETRCRVWLEKSHVTPEGKAHNKKMNIFNR